MDASPLSCDRVLRMSSLFHDDRLDEEWNAAVGAHLLDCVACRAEIDALDELGSAIRHAPMQVVAPDLADRVRAALRAGQHLGLDNVGDCSPVKSFAFGRFLNSRVASAAAVVLSLLTFGVAGYVLGRNGAFGGDGQGLGVLPYAKLSSEDGSAKATPVTIAALTNTGFEPGPFVRGAQSLVDDVLVMEPAVEPASRERQRLVLVGQLDQFELASQAHSVLAVIRPETGGAGTRRPVDHEMEQIGRLAQCVLVVESALEDSGLDLGPLRTRLSRVAFDGVFEPLRELTFAGGRRDGQVQRTLTIRTGGSDAQSTDLHHLQRFLEFKAIFVEGSSAVTTGLVTSRQRLSWEPFPGNLTETKSGSQILMKELVSEPGFVIWVHSSGLAPNLQTLGSRLQNHDQESWLHHKDGEQVGAPDQGSTPALIKIRDKPR